MTGARIAVDLRDGLTPGLAALRKAMGNTTPLMATIGVALVRETKDRFDREEAPDGKKWQALSPGYAAIKQGGLGILRQSAMRGGLQGSITYSASHDLVQVGSNKEYAAVHQFGATIRPKTAKALFFMIKGANGHVYGIHARSVTIPARPYLGLSTTDGEAIAEVVGLFLQRKLAAR